MFSFCPYVHFVTIIVVVFLVLPSSTGVDERYKTCVSTIISCGNNVSNVWYPFWVNGRPQYCGLPDLQLQCLHGKIGDYTFMAITKDGAPYKITSLKYFSSGVTLEHGVLPLEMTCTSYSKDISNIFKISPSVENIKLFYKCTSGNDEHNKHYDSVPCYQGLRKNNAYYVPNMSAHKNFTLCSSIEVPVSRTALDLYNKRRLTSLTQVFQRGFEVNYEYSLDCIKCKQSGGFCYEGNKRALIYEFLSNGSLEKFTFHGNNDRIQSLPWETLFSIALGIARGLDYLHRGCNARILHLDIKPHNILLDEEFRPKISDFGLAKLCPLQDSTISMLEARGTIGYIAPEVFCRTISGVSHKSDVYSFGMMVLDMVCGRKNLSADLQRSSEVYFPQWIYNHLELEVETSFQGTVNAEEKAVQRKMILVSLWCIQTYPKNRPSMSIVVEMLQGCVDSIQMPPKPNLVSPPRVVSDNSVSLTETIELQR